MKPTARLNNKTGDGNILEEFSNHFCGVHQPNTAGADDKHKAFVAEFLSSNANAVSQADFPVINFTTVQERIDMLRLRKAAGHDGIVNEHVVYGGPNLTVHLSLLFTAMLRHSYVPNSFHFGIIKPIPKKTSMAI